jgi:aspartyl-tRNA(Asn)/glutamyl-tRNA(Gln) amidotransferase subunit C
MEMDINHIAQLARLELTEAEKEKYSKQLGGILDYVNKLSQAKTDGIETSDGGTRDLNNAWAEDSERIQNTDNKTQDLINMAPEKEKGQVKVKSVF